MSEFKPFVVSKPAVEMEIHVQTRMKKRRCIAVLIYRLIDLKYCLVKQHLSAAFSSLSMSTARKVSKGGRLVLSSISVYFVEVLMFLVCSIFRVEKYGIVKTSVK